MKEKSGWEWAWHIFQIPLPFVFLNTAYYLTMIPILCTRNILARYKIIYNILCVMNNNVSLYCRLSSRSTRPCSGRKWEIRNWSSGKQDLGFIFREIHTLSKMCQNQKCFRKRWQSNTFSLANDSFTLKACSYLGHRNSASVLWDITELYGYEACF